MSLERTLRPGGMCASPLMPRTSAPPSPEMNRCGTVTIRVGTGIRRSARAAASELLADAVVGDADDDLLGVQRGGGQRGAVQDQVRAAGQDRLVLPGRRLTLGGVDHDHRRQVLPAAGVEHRADLAGERETRRRRGRAARSGRRARSARPTDSAANPPCTSWWASRSSRPYSSKPAVIRGVPMLVTGGTCGAYSIRFPSQLRPVLVVSHVVVIRPRPRRAGPPAPPDCGPVPAGRPGARRDAMSTSVGVSSGR